MIERIKSQDKKKKEEEEEQKRILCYSGIRFSELKYMLKEPHFHTFA